MKNRKFLFIVLIILAVAVVGLWLYGISETILFRGPTNQQNNHIVDGDDLENQKDFVNNSGDSYPGNDFTGDGQSSVDENDVPSIDNSVDIGNTNNDSNLSGTQSVVNNMFLNYSNQFELKVGSNVTLFAYLNSKDNNITKDVTWSSSNSNVASVKGGLVSAHKEGTVTITATYKNGLKSTLKVVVKKKNVTNIKINNCEAGLKLKVGETKTVSYTITPSSSKKPTWTSSSSTVASVNSSGKITAKADGKTVISVDVGGYKATCNVEVYSTYTAKISKTKAWTNSFSSITETLSVVTKNHNGTEITSGLTYKWYLDSKEISGATSKTYSTNRYGVYRVSVYKSGKQIATTTYYPSATAINYTMDTSDTKFVFVNNPEALTDDDFVDKGKVVYKTSFDKNMELYFEHSRETTTPFYYGIRVYNPTNQNVTLTINKSGASACYNGCRFYAQTWEEYYTGNITYRKASDTGKIYLKESYVLSPGQYLYFWLTQDTTMKGNVKFMSTISDYKYAPYNDYLPSDAVPINTSWSWAFDGVLNLTAKVDGGGYVSSIGGKLEVANIAVSKNFYKAANKDKINKASTLATKKKSQLTGEYNGKPLVTNNAKFIIGSSTPKGTLPTYYSGTSDINNKGLFGGWITNLSGNYDNAYQREVIPLSGIATDGSKYTFTPFSSVITANYVVHYAENITVVNNSNKSRNVAFYVNSGSGSSSSIADTTVVAFVTNNSKGIVRNSYKTNGVTINPNATFSVFHVRTNIKVWSATVPANTTITVPSITMVGGMSYATLIKMMCVDNVCFDAFAQKEFTW